MLFIVEYILIRYSLNKNLDSLTKAKQILLGITYEFDQYQYLFSHSIGFIWYFTQYRYSFF